METSADAWVESFWDRLTGLSPWAGAAAAAGGGFRNPGPDAPVCAPEFIGHADLAFLDPFLRGAYKNASRATFAPLAMFRAVAFKAVRRIVGWDRLAHALAAHPRDALDLGFAVVDGVACVPDGEWLRRWARDVLGNIRWGARSTAS